MTSTTQAKYGGGMQYITLKQASKLIKRDTGIKFSEYEIARQHLTGGLQLFFDCAYLRDTDAMGFCSHITPPFVNIMEKYSHLLSGELPDFRFQKGMISLLLGCLVKDERGEVCFAFNKYLSVEHSFQAAASIISELCETDCFEQIMKCNIFGKTKAKDINELLGALDISAAPFGTFSGGLLPNVDNLIRSFTFGFKNSEGEIKNFIIPLNEIYVRTDDLIELGKKEGSHLFSLSFSDGSILNQLSEGMGNARISNSKKTTNNRTFLIGLMLDAFKDYEGVLSLAGKKNGDKITQSDIVAYISGCHPEMKGKGVSKRQLEDIFAEANRLISN